MIRQLLLKASESTWLRRNASGSRLLRRAARRFLPGEALDDALAACGELAKRNIAGVLTYLGESVSDRTEACAAATQYRQSLERIRSCPFSAELSVKLTQLGLDLDSEFCLENFTGLLSHVPAGSTIWIDMEQSGYVDRTLFVVERARLIAKDVGVCVQAYLRRTEQDVDALIATGTAVRLVKGAYAEPREIAFAKKSEVDENYFRLAKKLLGAEARRNGVRAAIATHDYRLIERIIVWAQPEGLKPADLEFQMLYGIQNELLQTLAKKGHRCRVLVSYGTFWFPWFMRRLAERPANLLFLIRNPLSQ